MVIALASMGGDRAIAAWMAQQARNMNSFFDELPERPTLLICDHDTKFTAEFDAILKSEGVDVKEVGPVAPDLNAYAERWVQAIKQECLEHFIVFGEDHLRHITGEYVTYHNEERPHQVSAIRDCAALEKNSRPARSPRARSNAASAWAGR